MSKSTWHIVDIQERTLSSKPVPVIEILIACYEVWEAVTLPECPLVDGGKLGSVGKFPERVKTVLIQACALEELLSPAVTHTKT